jgi:hypothetical protein
MSPCRKRRRMPCRTWALLRLAAKEFQHFLVGWELTSRYKHLLCRLLTSGPKNIRSGLQCHPVEYRARGRRVRRVGSSPLARFVF